MPKFFYPRCEICQNETVVLTYIERIRDLKSSNIKVLAGAGDGDMCTNSTTEYDEYVDYDASITKENIA